MMRLGRKAEVKPDGGLVPDDNSSAFEVFARAAAEASVAPSALMECLYYAGEEDLLEIMRLVAALEPPQRAELHESLKRLSGSTDSA